MLGRHVYRVTPVGAGGWTVHKEGEQRGRGERPTQAAAIDYAAELAAHDEPSRLVVEDANGALIEERMFGLDDSALPGDSARPGLGHAPGKGPGKGKNKD
jgi:Uncharacterized protein conserved in bacteria (DUF2188)